MIKYVVFDFDGTLVDSKAVFISVFNQLAEKHKFKKMESGNIDYLRQLSIPERCKYLNLPLYKLPYLSTQFLSLYKQSIKEVLLVKGIRYLLNELTDKGYSLAIISSNSENNIRQFLLVNQINIINIIYSSNNIFGKDRVIKKFLKTYKLQSQDVIYVGDEARDIIACKKNNVKTIWVSWGYDVQEAVEKHYPDYIADIPTDILDIVLASKTGNIFSLNSK